MSRLCTTYRWRSGFALVVVTLCTSGCLKFEDTIVVDESAGVQIEVRVTGSASAFGELKCLPEGPEWLVREVPVDNRQNDQPQKEIFASRRAGPAEVLPESYLNSENPRAAIHLRFPTQVKSWREGNRVFYEFRRIYQARRFLRFMGPPKTDSQLALEERILDFGIFEASEQDRQTYLAILEEEWGDFARAWMSESAGQLFARGLLEGSDLDRLMNDVESHLAATVSHEMILRILGMDDDGMDRALNGLRANMFNSFISYVENLVPTAAPPMRTALESVELEWNITSSLDHDSFHVTVRLPGRVISTNGLISGNSPGEIGWTVMGPEIHDRDVPLHALSVVVDDDDRRQP